jgi:hypothetical protein
MAHWVRRRPKMEEEEEDDNASCLGLRMKDETEMMLLQRVCLSY